MIPTIFSIARRGQMLARGLLGDQDGAAAVVIAVALTGVVGLAGLATEGANWYFTSRRMQSAADAAAYSAATSLAANENLTDFTAEGKWVAAAAGYGFTSSNATVTINNPPQSGPNSGNSNAVEVIITQTPTRMISALFMNSPPTIRARAVALMSQSQNGCVLALNRSDVIDTSDTGGGTINLTNCDMYVNSDDPSGALTMSGSTTINTSGVYVTGGISESGGSTLNSGGNTHTGVAPINDPYADISVPTWSRCDYSAPPVYPPNPPPAIVPGTGLNGSGIYVICGGVDLSSGTTLTLTSGTTYVIAGGSFHVRGGATLTGTNVTIVLTEDPNNPNKGYATMKIDGNSTVTLSAPTTGTYAGLAVFQDRNAGASASPGTTNSMEGGANESITGAIYFPSEPLNFAGNSSGSATCTQLVVEQLTFTGATSIGSNCTGIPVDHFGNAKAQLVE